MAEQQRAWWEGENQQELDRLYGKPDRKVIPLRGNQKPQEMTPVRELLQPKAGTPPPELFWTCAKCGEIPPFQLMSHWVRRSCACEKKERREQEEAEQMAAWRSSQIYRTYGGWLGEGWSDTQLASCTLASYKREKPFQREAWNRVNAWFAGGMRGNLLLHGTYGTGKTHLAAAICNALRERRVTSLFVSAPKYFAARNSLMKSDGDYARLDKMLIGTPLAVLDDVDKAHHTDPRQEAYWLIIDERAKAGKPTIVTCNSMDTALATLGQATFSRLMIGVESIEMKGEDYRTKNTKEKAK